MMDTRSTRWINFRRRLIGLGMFVIAWSASADDPAAQTQQALPPKATAESPWQQVMPNLNEPMAISPAISIALSPRKPSDLKEKATYRGGKQSYGYVRAGDPDSVRLAVVVDEVSSSEVDLYLDADRDLVIDSNEKLAAIPDQSLSWRAPIELMVKEAGKPKLNAQRELIFTRSRIRGGLRCATRGYFAGTVDVAGKLFASRRVDGNANGNLSDSNDYFWIDLNADGMFDQFTEQFPIASIVMVGKQRMIVKPEPWGRSLKLEPLVGEGTLVLTDHWHLPHAEVLETNCNLSTETGIIATLRASKSGEGVLPQKAPIGDYATHGVYVQLKDKQGEVWNFLFNSYRQPKRHPHKVLNNQTTAIDPIGKLEFKVYPNIKEGESIKPGQSLWIDLGLNTADGLYINDAYTGTSMRSRFGLVNNELTAKVRLKTTSGKVLDESSSGFS